MIAENLLSHAVKLANCHYTGIVPYNRGTYPKGKRNKKYTLYAHVPFCESLCPYCSFNRYPFEEGKALSYFDCLRREMRLLSKQGFDFESMYIGGGTPTILPDELAETIRLAKELFSVNDVSTETNPNHLDREHLDPISGLVDRMSVGVQSFDDTLLKKMCRYHKYGSGSETAERIAGVRDMGIFKTLNVDMIFNFPGQTKAMIKRDIKVIKSCGCNQVTFYPLMASPSVEKSLLKTLGRVDYKNEKAFYELICHELTEGRDGDFDFGSVWTFNKKEGSKEKGLIDEYVVDYEEYPAIGAGSMSFLNRRYFVNAFSLEGYEKRIRSGKMGIWGSVKFNKRDHMRYHLLMQLFSLSLDKKRWYADFGCSVKTGLPAEYLFLKLNGAFERDDERFLTLSRKGRYLVLIMMREFFIGVNTVRDKARRSKS